MGHWFSFLRQLMSTKQKFCEHCREFVYTITYRQHLVHNCAVLLPPPTKKCKHSQDFVYTRMYRQHLVHSCAVLLPPPAKKCKLDGVKNQVPFIVCLCVLEVVPVPFREV